MANKKFTKKKSKIRVSSGRMYVHASFNNTIISITDDNGNVLAWNSAGASGFKGSRKSTPYASQVAAEKVLSQVSEIGMSELRVFIKGVGPGRESAVRAVANTNIVVNEIKDITPIPHNGCRPRKARRV